MDRKGITVIEVLVAAAIMSVFMLGVFQLYRSGTESFILGSWKTRAQKDSQLFLEELRSVVEMAGNALVLRDDSIDASLQLPLRLHTGANESQLELATLDDGQLVAFFNIVTPCTLHSTFAEVQEPGTWLGVTLIWQNGSLQYRTYNDPTLLPAEAMGWAIGLGGDFVAADVSRLRQSRTLRDIHAIEFVPESEDGVNRLIIRLFMRRPNASTTVSQEIRANMLRGGAIEWF